MHMQCHARKCSAPSLWRQSLEHHQSESILLNADEGATTATALSASCQEGRSAATLAAPTLTASPPTPGPDSDDGKVEAWGAASDVPPVRDSIAVGIIPLDIERDMWQSFAAVRRQRTLRLVKAAASLVRIGICAACSASTAACRAWVPSWAALKPCFTSQHCT